MTFKELLLQAKERKPFAIAEIFNMYQPLLLKESIIEGSLDKDLYQELCIIFLRCIELFRV